MQPKIISSRIALALLVSASVMLGGCGFKGPLTLPEQTAALTPTLDAVPTA